MFRPATTSITRVFISEGGSHPSHDPEYLHRAAVGSLSQSLGDVNPILAPSEDYYDDFDQVGYTKGPRGLVETSLTARFSANQIDKLTSWAEGGCQLTVHILYGFCTSPKDKFGYSKATILENCLITNVDTDDIGSLDDSAAINVTIDLSCGIRDQYQVTKLGYSYSLAATDIIRAVHVYERRPCKGCPVDTIILAAGDSSVGTSFDVYWSLDRGITWTSLTKAAGATVLVKDIGVVNGDVVVLAEMGGGVTTSIWYAPLEDHTSGGSPSYTEVTTGFASAVPRGMSVAGNAGGNAYILLAGGQLYKLKDAASGVSLVNAMSSTPLGIDALDEDLILFGDGRSVDYTLDGGKTIQSISVSGVGSSIANMIPVTRDIWWALASSEGLWYTEDGGQSWSQRTYPGFSTAALGGGFTGGVAASRDVLYVTDADSGATDGDLYRTIYHGADTTWRVQPEVLSSMPVSTVSINSIAVPKHNKNFVVIGGETTATAGFVIVGR